jgi:hypothetical protein
MLRCETVSLSYADGEVAFKEMYHTVAAQPLRDTAHQYSEGLSEEILEQALGPRRKDVLIATKVG